MPHCAFIAAPATTAATSFLRLQVVHPRVPHHRHPRAQRLRRAGAGDAAGAAGAGVLCDRWGGAGSQRLLQPLRAGALSKGRQGREQAGLRCWGCGRVCVAWGSVSQLLRPGGAHCRRCGELLTNKERAVEGGRASGSGLCSTCAAPSHVHRPLTYISGSAAPVVPALCRPPTPPWPSPRARCPSGWHGPQPPCWKRCATGGLLSFPSNRCSTDRCAWCGGGRWAAGNFHGRREGGDPLWSVRAVLPGF